VRGVRTARGEQRAIGSACMRRLGTTAGAKQWAERARVRLQVCDGRRPAARLNNGLSQGARRVRRPDRQAAAAQPGDLLQPDLHLGASHPSCVSAPRFTPLRSAEGFLSASWRLSNVDRCLQPAGDEYGVQPAVPPRARPWGLGFGGDPARRGLWRAVLWRLHLLPIDTTGVRSQTELARQLLPDSPRDAPS